MFVPTSSTQLYCSVCALAKQRAKQRERHTKPEYLAKQREYRARRWRSTPEYRAKQRERQTKPEYLAKQREYQARRWRSTPEYRAKHRESAARSRARPECRAKRRDAKRERQADPEYRAKQRKYWSGPEYLAKKREYYRQNKMQTALLKLIWQLQQILNQERQKDNGQEN